MSREQSREDIRDNRLHEEFARMMAMRAQRGPGALFDVHCADLSEQEGEAFLGEVSFEVIKKGTAGFLPVEDFMRKFPGQAPEKYMFHFSCRGLARRDEVESWRRSTPPPPAPPGEPELVAIDEHLLEVVFGWEYPSTAPMFIWWTPIWHPNIRPPYLCTEGRPFAVSTTLDEICALVGEMIQYRNYNVESPLNKAAAAWASEHRAQLPLDTRGLLDGRERPRALVSLVDDETVPPDARGRDLVEFVVGASEDVR